MRPPTTTGGKDERRTEHSFSYKRTVTDVKYKQNGDWCEIQTERYIGIHFVYNT